MFSVLVSATLVQHQSNFCQRLARAMGSARSLCTYGRPRWLIRIDWGLSSMYEVRIPVGPDICHRDCAYAVLQTVQMPGVYSVAYKEPLKSFEIRVGHSPGSGLPSVAILP